MDRIDKNEYKYNELDRAALFLYGKIMDNLISKITNRWLNIIRNKEKDYDRIRWNIIAGFCNVMEMLDEKIDFEKKEKKNLIKYLNINSCDYYFSDVIKNISDVELIDLIAKKKHLLFNFYCYNIIDAYGDKYLTPTVIAYDYIKKSSDNYNKIYSILNNSAIPFRIYNSKRYIHTYKNQLLPIHAGLAPFYTNKNYQTSNNIKAIKVDNFLIHLTILHKREDYLQGHFSALIKSIRNEKNINPRLKKEPIFTIVFSSIIPQVFSVHDRCEFEKIIHEIEALGIFSGLSSYGHTNSEFIKSEITPHDERTEKIENKTWHLKLNNSLGLDIENNIIYHYKQFYLKENVDKDKVKLLSYINLNIGAIEYIFKKLFPSGPWFEKSIMQGFPKIDYSALKEYIRMINHIVRGEIKSADISTFYSLDKFSNILPFKECNSEIIELNIHDQNYYFVILSLKEKSCFEKHKVEIRKIADMVSKMLSAYNSEIDGQNPELLNLQKKWDYFFASPSNNEKKRFVYKNISFSKKLMNDIYAIVLLKKDHIYIPSKEETISLFNSYIEFWTIQKTLKHIYEKNINISSFNEYTNVAQHIYKYKCNYKTPKITIEYGKDKEENILLSKALLYFGIDVSEAIFTENENVTISFDKRYSIDKFNDFYSSYLTDYLRCNKSPEMLRFIFGNKIDTIDFLDNYKMKVKKDKAENEIKWNLFETIDQELLLINYDNFISKEKTAFIQNDKKIKMMRACTDCDRYTCSYYADRWNFGKNSTKSHPLNKYLTCDFIKSEIMHFYDGFYINDLQELRRRNLQDVAKK